MKTRKFYEHFIVNEYDPANPKSPLMVSDRGENNIGSVKASWPEDEILDLLHKAYEAGMDVGKKICQNEIRSKLGL